MKGLNVMKDLNVTVGQLCELSIQIQGGRIKGHHLQNCLDGENQRFGIATLISAGRIFLKNAGYNGTEETVPKLDCLTDMIALPVVLALIDAGYIDKAISARWAFNEYGEAMVFSMIALQTGFEKAFDCAINALGRIPKFMPTEKVQVLAPLVEALIKYNLLHKFAPRLLGVFESEPVEVGSLAFVPCTLNDLNLG